MQTIYKYPLQLTDEQEIHMPKGAKILTIQTQKGYPCLWVQVDDKQPQTPRTIITRGTGHPIPDSTLLYLGTYQLDGGALIFHVFEAA